MTYCTVVEFEWDGDFDHEGFRRTLGRLSEESPSPAGLLSRITGIDAEIIVTGSLDEAQIAKLREAAENCRISRALNVPVALRLTLAAN